ncbi:UNVERIFIED_CONTAM: hypothetical protein NCL1_22012 [Trichonephila clavipes]
MSRLVATTAVNVDISICSKASAFSSLAAPLWLQPLSAGQMCVQSFINVQTFTRLLLRSVDRKDGGRNDRNNRQQSTLLDISVAFEHSQMEMSMDLTYSLHPLTFRSFPLLLSPFFIFFVLFLNLYY